MASKRNLRKKACTGKRCFETEAAANNAIRAIYRRAPIGQRSRMHAYRCTFCAAYHIGHPPAKVRQSIADTHDSNHPL